MEDFITAVLPQLTLTEKVSLLSGSSFVAASGVPRLGIPAIRIIDSVNGVKGTSHINGIPTLCFPSTTCLGATWNQSLMTEMGREVAVQARHKGASVILGPTVNIHRDPRAGRNFECWSEDPLLTGKMAASLVNGIQAGGVAACSKHFVGNESETKRRFYHVKENIDGRTMRETYLAAFKYLLADSDPMALMTAYNKVGGHFCSERPIIKRVLREEWNYGGCIMSDWFGTRSSIEALTAGLDLEMPGPSVFRGQKLLEAVEKGLIEERAIDESAKSVLKLIHGTRESHLQGEEKSFIDDQANSLAKKVAAQGIVLLKNENDALPLRVPAASRVAVIGPYVMNPPIGGGGSAKVSPQYNQRPFDCLQSAFLDPSLVWHSTGMKVHVTIPEILIGQTLSKSGKAGFDISYFIYGHEDPVLEEFQSSAQAAMLGFLKPPLKPDTFSHFEISTTLTPLTTGKHTLAIQATGSFILLVDGQIVLTETMQPPPSVEDFLFVPQALERSASIPMTAGQAYHILAKIKPYAPLEETGEPRVHAAKLCSMEEYSDVKLQDDAVAVASGSDISIIFAGRNAEMESEGFDLDGIKLPSNQEELIIAVAAASKKTILVLYGGNPIDISAYEYLVDAILFAHFPGQEGSQAIVDILTGKTCPSGKLAVSWPKRLEDVGSFQNFPAQKNVSGEWEVEYKEGLKVGYRNPDFTPRYPFGYGLSYTNFEYSDLSCSILPSRTRTLKETELVIEVNVTNVGMVGGYEVVQVFMSDLEASIWRPREELKAFEKIWLEPGESKLSRMIVKSSHAFSFWDDSLQDESCWRAEAGLFNLRIGDLSKEVLLEEGFTWRGL